MDKRKEIIKSLEGKDKEKVYAEDGEDFQEYVDDKGNRVPAGTLVGWDVTENGETEFKLKKGIHYNNHFLGFRL